MTIVHSRGETPSELKGKWSAFYEVFPDYHPERVLTIVYAPLSIALVTIFLCKDTRRDTSKRHLIGYVLFCASSIGFFVLDLATPGKGGIEKYVGLCLLVMVSSVADAHVQGEMAGNLAFMCPEFVQLKSYVAGLSASGALTSVLRLISKAAFENAENGLRKGALLYIAISIVFQFQCVFFYAFVFPNLPVVKYYRAKAAGEGSETIASNLSIVGAENRFDQRAHSEATSIKRLLNHTRKICTRKRARAFTSNWVCDRIPPARNMVSPILEP
nr:equilibrative nucleotide transporter 3-like [Tanacetum cinerariifolium]